jgi:hypothetical protein
LPFFIVKVHVANIHDTMSGCRVYQAVKVKYSSIKGGCGDAGYRGRFVEFVRAKWGTDRYFWKIQLKVWQVLPWRWCVERTFAWAIWASYFVKGL